LLLRAAWIEGDGLMQNVTDTATESVQLESVFEHSLGKTRREPAENGPAPAIV